MRLAEPFVDASGNVDILSFRNHWHSDEVRAERRKLHKKKALAQITSALDSAKTRYNECLQESKFLNNELNQTMSYCKKISTEDWPASNEQKEEEMQKSAKESESIEALEADIEAKLSEFSQIQHETSVHAHITQVDAMLKTAEKGRTDAWKYLKRRKRAHEEATNNPNIGNATEAQEAEDFEMAEQMLQMTGRRRKKLHILKSSASKSIIHAIPSDFDRRRVGDCPICLDQMPSSNKHKQDSVAFMPCCGSWACIPCLHDLIAMVTEESVHNHLSELKYDPTEKYRCPLCRDPLPFTPQSAGIALVSQSAKGDPLCQYVLAHFHLGLYRKGHPILPRPTRALGVKLLKDAADRRYPPACILLGSFHLEGLEEESKILFERSVPKALQILHSVEDTGDPQILSMLADVYHREGNKYKHLVHLKSAADVCHAASAGKIGIMYLSGKGKDKVQREKAKNYLRLAFKEGDDSIRGKFGFYLANIYRDEGDIDNCISTLDAAAANHAEASYVLGSYFLTGKYVDLDRTEARAHLSEAAGMGHTVAKEVMELRGLCEATGAARLQD